MALRRWIRNFFGFTRAQTNGSIVLLGVMFMVIFSQPVYRWWISSKPRDFSRERQLLDSLSRQWEQPELTRVPDEDSLPVMRFSFDPNTASLDELRELGFSENLARRLINYRNKGGTFVVKRDLKKLYGMDETFYASLEAYILLPEEVVKRESVMPAMTITERPAPVKFNLNVADTTLLKSIRGIGSKLSARIVQYRESLGGFIRADQLYAVYGLDSLVVDRLAESSFIPEDFQPRRINLNTATEEELAVHPYISRRMARAIVTYRFQHSKYASVDDLRNVLQLSEEQRAAIKPYLTVD
jgi:competence protein ComEA